MIQVEYPRTSHFGSAAGGSVPALFVSLSPSFVASYVRVEMSDYLRPLMTFLFIGEY